MTKVTRKISKLTLSTAATAILLAGFATPAMAQVTTDDRTAQEWLQRISEAIGEEGDTDEDTLQGKMEEIREDQINFQDDDTRPHYEEQIKHYEREVARLDAMIKAIGYYKVTGDTDEEQNEKTEINEAFDLLDGIKERRERVTNAADHTKTTFDGGGATEDGEFSMPFGEEHGSLTVPDEYFTRYGIVPASEVYREASSPLRYNLEQLQGALFMNEATVFEVDASRQQRFEVYDELLRRAKEANDLHTTMQINNAIQLENGRNIAMLIDLQTAMLNADSVDLRQRARAAQKNVNNFGDTNAGLAEIQTAVAATNAIASLLD